MKDITAYFEGVRNMVSIIVPLYNAEGFLAICIESVLTQNHEHFELILINDGSTDRSSQICSYYAGKDRRVIVINTTNSGPSHARNQGLLRAQGEFIFFLDADDSIKPGALALLVGHQRETRTDLVIGSFVKIQGGSVLARTDIELPKTRVLENQDLAAQVRLYLKKPNKHLLFAYGWGRLFKASIIRDHSLTFDTTLHTFEDVAFNFKYLRHTSHACFVKETVYVHAVHQNFLSATMSMGQNPKKLFGFTRALPLARPLLSGKAGPEIITQEIGHAYVTLTIIQLIRMCGQINERNWDTILEFIRELAQTLELRENFKHYNPGKGESRLIPCLLWLQLPTFVMRVCAHKAKKRYEPPVT